MKKKLPLNRYLIEKRNYYSATDEDEPESYFSNIEATDPMEAHYLALKTISPRTTEIIAIFDKDNTQVYSQKYGFILEDSPNENT